MKNTQAQLDSYWKMATLRANQYHKNRQERDKALLNLTTTGIKFAKEKALRDEAERMITLAKEGSLSSRRRAIGYKYDNKLVHTLFEKAQDRYGDRKGGYTRIVRTVRRRGDNAEMAIIELV